MNQNKNVMKKVIEFPKGATIEIREDKVVIEYEEAFVPKNGDFCFIDEDYENLRTLFISNGKTMKNGNFSLHAAKCGTKLTLNPIEWVSGSTIYGLSGTPRPATEDERTELLEALHKVGKDWDADKMEIVDLKWIPKVGETVYYASVVSDEKASQTSYSDTAYQKRLLERGLLFRSRAEAIACTERMLEAAKQK